MRMMLARHPQVVKALKTQSLSGSYWMFFQVSAAVFKIRYEEVAPGSW